MSSALPDTGGNRVLPSQDGLWPVWQSCVQNNIFGKKFSNKSSVHQYFVTGTGSDTDTDNVTGTVSDTDIETVTGAESDTQKQY